ncbi:LysR family transcriptional regulator [Lacrimispora saccharolytica]|uniref:Transcriptional regulator, LysR family n=1 Tax=Lacrimispora saccharolytica (strain ATCC 35040 / DSM 2544 / NRCC 2533 / WM1) TaxID=610130 RepID=D9R2S8_LACSW|nr:LysR family transcriptional regulator [Lacrimispora saccharolytica]ADL02918.1 transcriptional regulator, LysR family [[Clostridium] saccharolyticum WM1]QRV18886.1 LysR family transcriptional regulator [Lacrimispora saccharolytica]
MESLELRIFREVAYEKSVSRAAEKMGYVQSNVTAHIHNLEEELGTELFIRHSKGVSLTDDGKQLLSYADQVISLLDNAKNSFIKSLPTLRIGATQTLSAHRLPLWLSVFKKQYPQVNLSVFTDTQINLIQSVADGDLDCAFVNSEFNHPRLESVFSFQEELVFITPQNMKVGDIPYQPIVVTNICGCPYRNLLETWVIRNTNRQPDIIQYDTVEGIIKAVSLGMGISLLPQNVLPEASGIQTFPAKDIGSLNVQLLTSKNLNNPTVNSFIDMIQNHSDY